MLAACGRRGDPIPRPRAQSGPCQLEWQSLRRLRVQLPRQDIHGQDLVGLDAVRVHYLAFSQTKPTPDDILKRGEVVLERRRPDLPGPGAFFTLDLKNLNRPAGWIVVVAVRVGNVAGEPSQVLVWMDPGL